MQTRFEHFAVTSMLGQSGSPPRLDGKLCFSETWERQAFGVALALSKSGHFDWEDFRQKLIAAIGEWESSHSLDNPSWSYYERWLTALERLVVEQRLATPEELAAIEGLVIDARCSSGEEAETSAASVLAGSGEAAGLDSAEIMSGDPAGGARSQSADDARTATRHHERSTQESHHD
ncbi:MAG: nitrile hydratase accessory protein [Rhizobiales bacterium]|nr:nitrile hydratase accessory protein [Hyphomicrobiales bacterium]